MTQPRSEHFETLRAMIDRSIHGTATADDLVSIERIIGSDAAARRFYLDYMNVHVGLQWEQGALQDVADVMSEREATPIVQPIHSRRWIGWTAGLAAAAAIVAAGLITLFSAGTPEVIEAPQGPTVAVVTGVSDVMWRSAPMASGDPVAPQTVQIDSGRLTIDFLDGTSANLVGPALVRVHGKDTVEVQQGILSADARPGFVVLAPGGAKIVDLGTRFGVVVDRDGATRVQVREGAVYIEDATGEARDLHTGEHQRLVAGRFVNEPFDPDQAYADAVLADDPAAFWPLTDRRDGKFEDLTGRFALSVTGQPTVDYDPTLGGAAVVTPGEVHLSVLQPERLRMFRGANGFTFETWLNPKRVDMTGMLMLCEPGSSTSGWSFNLEPHAAGGYLVLERYGAETLRFEDAVVARNEWAHVALVCESTRATVYINGEPAQTIEFAATAARLPETFYTKLIGRSAGGDFVGSLAGAAYHDRPLTAERIAAHYHARHPIDSPPAD